MGGRKRVPCIVCSRKVSVVKSYANSRVLCRTHREDRKLWLSRLSLFRSSSLGEKASLPYSFHVIQGIDLRPMVWVVSLYHKGHKETTQIPLCQYLAEVKYERFLMEDEEVKFLDGNSQNLDISNLAFSPKDDYKRVVFKRRHDSRWLRPSSS